MRALSAPALALALLLASQPAQAAQAPPMQAKQSRPHIALIVVDDWGSADASFLGNTNVRTPNIDALYQGGMRLSRLYGQPVCSPSRTAIHTGRLPLAYGLSTYVIDPDGVDYGLNLNETTLPQLLRDRGSYATHAVGKWHCGMSAWNYTPTFRGYDSFHGFYTGGQDYFTHMAGPGYDFHIDNGRNCGAGCSQVDWASQGEYSTHVFTRSACSVIAAHDPATPLFLYLAYQAVHSPDQVPQAYIDPFNATIPHDAKRRTFAGMLAALDEGIGNVTAALRTAGMLDNTLILIMADNGGPIACGDGTCGDATGTSNWPLRGGKHSLYEGGVRLLGVASGPMLYGRGENHSGLMHHADWLPTLLEAAGVQYDPAPGFELHGASQWAALTQRGAPSPRNESVLNIDPYQPAIGSLPKHQGNAAIVTAEGWKLHLGMPGPPFGWGPANSSASDGSNGADGGAPRVPPACNASAWAVGQCLPGGDLKKAPLAVASAGACCAACAALPDCAAFTYRASTRLCYLKGSAAQAPTSDPDCTSAGGGAPPPPEALWPLRNSSVALYNVLTDEGEHEDVSADHPEVVAQLTARLAAWATKMKYDYWATSSTVDPRSNPALRNGTWQPWLV